jgi:hypothetical protein
MVPFMAHLDTTIADCETRISYKFGNKLLCASALSTFPTQRVVEGVLHPLKRNDRIAVYGDAVANSYFCRKWIATSLEMGTATSRATIFQDNVLISHRSMDCYPRRSSGKCQLGV